MPAATPDGVVRKWEAAIAEMVKDPAFRATTDRLWMNLDYLDAAEMTAFVVTTRAEPLAGVSWTPS